LSRFTQRKSVGTHGSLGMAQDLWRLGFRV
jgi:hypothetical protein